MKQITLWLLIGVLALSACGGGGAQTDMRSECSRASGPNECMVTLVSLEGGIYRYDVENSAFWQGTTNIEVTVQITVEQGTVQVWLKDSRGTKASISVKPEQTAELTGVAQVMTGVDKRSFSVYFEALGDTQRAKNVRAEIHYNTQHTIQLDS